MRKELNDIALIEQYLMNQLVGEEFAAFESRLTNDQSFKISMEQQKDLMKGIERIGLKEEIHLGKTKFVRRKFGTQLGIIVIVISCFISSIYYFNGNEKVKQAEHKSAQPIHKEEVKVQGQEREQVNHKIIDHAEEEKEVIEKTYKSSVIKEIKMPESKEAEPTFAKLPVKTTQKFRINPQEDTTITGSEGTVISFKANSFNADNEEEIIISLREFYKTSDMVFEGLSTYDNHGHTLESGGMIYLEAETVSGEKVDLKDQTSYDISFPTDDRTEGMNLYEGVEDSHGVLNWEMASEEIHATKRDARSMEDEFNGDANIDDERLRVISIFGEHASKMPPFLSDKRDINDYINEHFKYPTWAVEKEVKGWAFLRITVNRLGLVQNASVFRAKKLPRTMYSKVQDVFKNMPQFERPKASNGKPAQISYSYKLDIDAKGKQGYSELQIKRFNDSIKAVREANKIVSNRKLVEMERNSFNEQLKGGSVTRKQKDELLKDISYYTFESTGLGWINCDKPLPGEGTRMDYFIANESEDMRIQLVYHDLKSVLIGDPMKGGYVFNDVLEGKRISLFAYKLVEGVPYACLKETTTSSTAPDLQFKLLTEEGIKYYADKLNKRRIN